MTTGLGVYGGPITLLSNTFVNSYICIGGEWKQIIEVYIVKSGVWKSVDEASIVISSTWVDVA